MARKTKIKRIRKKRTLKIKDRCLVKKTVTINRVTFTCKGIGGKTPRKPTTEEIVESL